MHTDLQFSEGFLSLRDDGEVGRLGDRMLADAGIERREDGQFEREGIVLVEHAAGPTFRDILGRLPLLAPLRIMRRA
jgi:hypothetical protein